MNRMDKFKMEIIHQYKDKWYFWNEVWSDIYGPFDSRKEAKEKLEIYCENFLNIKEGVENASI